MLQTEITYFTLTMFLALAVLIKWKYRRDVNAARMNRGLRGYAAAMSAVGLAGPEETRGENLFPV
jgi:predicted negative regulator of RcsB-dependent stress response